MLATHISIKIQLVEVAVRHIGDGEAIHCKVHFAPNPVYFDVVPLVIIQQTPGAHRRRAAGDGRRSEVDVEIKTSAHHLQYVEVALVTVGVQQQAVGLVGVEAKLQIVLPCLSVLIQSTDIICDATLAFKCSSFSICK